jgi:hypothetical protein
MRTPLCTGIVAIAAIVGALALGVDSASASLLCHTSSCTVPDVYPADTELAASLEEGTQAKFATSLGTITCESSAIAGKITALAGKSLPLEVSELTFGKCKLGKTSCTVTTTILPTSPSLEASGEGDGTFSLTGGEVHVTCGVLINCAYLAPTLQAEGGNPARLSAEEVVLSTVKGEKLTCPNTSELDAAYTLAEPAPAYVVVG